MPYDVYLRLGVSGDGDNTGKGGAIERYRVVFDSIVTDHTLVALLPEIPKMLTQNAFDPLAVVTKVEAEQSEDDPTVWDVTVTYSRVSRDPEQTVDNPLNKPPKVRWGSVRVLLPFIYDVNGKMVTNSVGDLYSPPPMYETFHDLATVTYNLASVPVWLRDMKGRTNSNLFTCEGLEVKPECARVNEVDISEWNFENNVRFRTAVLQIEMGREIVVPRVSFRDDAGILTVTENITVGCFRHIEQDAGYRQKKAGKVVKITDATGLELPQPSLLDGLAGALPTPITPGQEVYRLFEKPPGKADFSVLNLPT